MKSQPVIPTSEIDQRRAGTRVPPNPLAIDSRGAANDELVRHEKYEKVPNPLWAINIAMGAFFIAAALIVMFS